MLHTAKAMECKLLAFPGSWDPDARIRSEQPHTGMVDSARTGIIEASSVGKSTCGCRSGPDRRIYAMTFITPFHLKKYHYTRDSTFKALFMRPGMETEKLASAESLSDE